MTKESILLGIAGIALGIGLIIKGGPKAILPALVPILIGVGLLIFYKEENKIEQRKDKPKKRKKQ